ncbi:aminotransferase class I/II-fold pyridoxal phosphate-dependent enzyme [Bacillus sp. WMMC1349]|uniref:aminotransferase class I/II-fold pyridoxal phosphate-dependent enzyme n=1 Tax=Bacillus sp. WMMC1349 TaxID=2736254 RepID=UPI0015525DF6|nr:aminotransferase class I/II-fold pyridoxal phosphate-dependent enzyme [Bacillus sp. WMMC1349]NPC93437.1 aminotransferase class I/II-fold pyridoxal phosphate-dependent enzyme [Bacillus sp. WMMC1349]
MNKLAAELNATIQQKNPFVFSLLSNLGKKIFFPKGILTQAAEAKEKAYKMNATIGIATEHGEPMHLKGVSEQLHLKPADVFPYAPPGGKMELRQEWKNKLIEDNRSLEEQDFHLPIVTHAITHGLSIVADLFCDSHDKIIVPDKLWGNYKLTFETRRDAQFAYFPFFNENNQFNVNGLAETIEKSAEEKLIILLNFPNNPTGYTPTEEEATQLADVLRTQADAGKKLLVIVDDAYFGLFYEDSMKESIFSKIVHIHPNVFAVKLDGATKEEFVWGLRVGFLTFPNLDRDVNEALEKKVLGIIRSTISSGAHPSQTIVLNALKHTSFQKEKTEKFNILLNRAKKVKDVLTKETKYHDQWDDYPFNSGYFMCLKLHHIHAEELRNHLLAQYGIGTIAINDTDLRIAFSCIEESEIKTLFDTIYQAAVELTKE